ncbi:ATP-binding protein, partial [Streptomyces sp. NPDC042898]
MLDLIGALRARVAALVDARSAGDPTAGDPLRGLYVTEETARRIAAEPVRAAGPDDAVPLPDTPGSSRLAELARTFGLSALDAHVLVAALAPDVDRGFEALYGYLNDDVGRRRATVGLVLDLAGTGPFDPAARDRFHPAAPLLSGGLLVVEDEDRPLPGRALRVPERLVAHLLGDDGRLDAELLGAGVELLPPTGAGEAAAARAGMTLGARVAAAGPVTVHLRERVPGAATDSVVAALRDAGRPVLRYRPESVDIAAARALLREARLRGAAVVVEPLPQQPGLLVRVLASSVATVVLAGTDAPDPRWAPEAELLALDAPDGTTGPGDLWHRELGALEGDFDLDEATAPYRLSGDQVRRAARSARA